VPAILIGFDIELCALSHRLLSGPQHSPPLFTEQTLDLQQTAMIGRLNHVAIVVPDLAAASGLYRQVLGAQVSEPRALPAHGVTVVFVDLPNTRIELLEPLGDASPVRGFLERNPAGGIHHVCYEVDDIIAARDRLRAEGARVLGDGEPRLGAHDKPVLFLHPKDFCGTLIELEQV
jgi:methylmalonyl-CoA/ethylmalonyl-CoA epimerase